MNSLITSSINAAWWLGSEDIIATIEIDGKKLEVQGGECELQDISMGFGSDHSYFTEGKRSVVDQNLGSLIATEMTRCIHCTRCVRFGEEIAGLPELGVISRGEKERISTYVDHSMR